MPGYVPLGVNEEMYEDGQRVEQLLHRAGYADIDVPFIQGPENGYRAYFLAPMGHLPGFRDRDYHPSGLRVRDGDIVELAFRLGAFDYDVHDPEDVEAALVRAIEHVGADWATTRMDRDEPHIIYDTDEEPPDSYTSVREAINITERFEEEVFGA